MTETAAPEFTVTDLRDLYLEHTALDTAVNISDLHILVADRISIGHLHAVVAEYAATYPGRMFRWADNFVLYY